MTACIQRSLAIGSEGGTPSEPTQAWPCATALLGQLTRAALHGGFPLIESPGHVGIGDSDGAGDQARNEVHT